jgi:hypothetical protein
MTDHDWQTEPTEYFLMIVYSLAPITITNHHHQKKGAHKFSLRSFRDVSWGNVLWMTTGLVSSAPQSQFESDTSWVDRTRTDYKDDGNVNDNWANICVHCINLTMTIGSHRTWQGGTTLDMRVRAARGRGRGWGRRNWCLKFSLTEELESTKPMTKRRRPTTRKC